MLAPGCHVHIRKHIQLHIHAKDRPQNESDGCGPKARRPSPERLPKRTCRASHIRDIHRLGPAPSARQRGRRGPEERVLESSFPGIWSYGLKGRERSYSSWFVRACEDVSGAGPSGEFRRFFLIESFL